MPDGIMDGFFKKVNKKVNLVQCPTPDMAILKEKFLKNQSKNCEYPFYLE